MESNESPILRGLNPAQYDAVVNYDAPSLIIAGAGSGKTRVLTSRIAYMIEQGVAPFNILALTFTNKAAESMRERIAQMLPDNRSRYIPLGTFHSVFFAHPAGERRTDRLHRFVHDLRTLGLQEPLKTIVRELNLPDEKYKPNVLASRISYAKNCLVTPGAYLANSVYATEDRQAQIPEFGNIYNIYCQRCKRNGAMDFDDLLFANQYPAARLPRRAGPLSGAVPLYSGGRVSGHQLCAVRSSAAFRRPIRRSASWRRRRSRSTRSAGPRSRTSFRSRRTTLGDGLQTGAELPFDAHDRRCGQFGDRPQLEAHGEALLLGRRRGREDPHPESLHRPRGGRDGRHGPARQGPRRGRRLVGGGDPLPHQQSVGRAGGQSPAAAAFPTASTKVRRSTTTRRSSRT